MNRDEALQKAQRIIEAEGWPWQQPVRIFKERPFIIFGRAQWVMITNANCKGGNAFVRLDAKTGNLLSKEYSLR
ncbi:MAG: hypothetical protein GY845_28870 [Planctomycetes bacterium]|nr:hypothetical protein [Planctomycetota bacterium]